MNKYPTRYIQDPKLLEKSLKKEIMINGKTFPIEKNKIWEIDQETANTQYQIHSFQAIIDSQMSLFVHRFPKNTSLILFCLDMLWNWLDLFHVPSPKHIQWMDMTTAYRVGSIVSLCETAEKNGIDWNRSRIKENLKIHLFWLYQFLKQDSGGKKKSNHVLFVSRFLILGNRFYEKYFEEILIPDVERISIQKFLTVFYENVDRHDKISKEHSTNYHILYFRQLRDFLNGIETNETLQILFEQMERELFYFIYPNGNFVPIGDTDKKHLSDKFPYDMAPLRYYSNVGYSILKYDSIYLSLSASYHSKYHKHMDELSIHYFNECPILIEGGRFSYDDYLPNKNPENERLRKTYFLTQRSKNSLVVNDDYYTFREVPNLYYGSSIYPPKKMIDSGWEMSGYNPLLFRRQQIHHERKVHFENEKILTITDVLDSPREFQTTRHFHFAKEWKFVHKTDSEICWRHENLPIEIIFEECSGGELHYMEGQMEPYIQGFTSERENNMESITVVEIRNVCSKQRTELQCKIKKKTF